MRCCLIKTGSLFSWRYRKQCLSATKITIKSSNWWKLPDTQKCDKTSKAVCHRKDIAMEVLPYGEMALPISKIPTTGTNRLLSTCHFTCHLPVFTCHFGKKPVFRKTPQETKKGWITSFFLNSAFCKWSRWQDSKMWDFKQNPRKIGRFSNLVGTLDWHIISLKIDSGFYWQNCFRVCWV